MLEEVEILSQSPIDLFFEQSTPAAVKSKNTNFFQTTISDSDLDSGDCDHSSNESEEFHAGENFEIEEFANEVLVMNETVPPAMMRVSSPKPGNIDPAFSLSSSADLQDNVAICQEKISTTDNVKLYEGSDLSMHDAVALTELFCSRVTLSEEGSTSLHSLIKAILPSDNAFPSGVAYVQHIKRDFAGNVRSLTKPPTHSLCILKYRWQLLDVIKRQLNQIFNYAEFRNQNPNFYLNFFVAPPVVVKENQSLVFNLSIFTDGVHIKKSTFKKAIWPVRVQITDLPLILRMSRKNIVLAALFVGSGVLDWSLIVPQLLAELLSPIELHVDENLALSLTFKVNILLADLGAKSNFLNMYKFNGSFGCHYCTAESKTIGKSHSYYPFAQKGRIREPVLNNFCLNGAENEDSQKVPNVVGVKGKGAFASLIDGLPLAAPIDYMHCVLIGVFPEVLKLCYKNVSSVDKTVIKTVISQLACPCEVISYSRKIRPIDAISQFKAKEFFNYLFYISPLIFLNRLTEQLYDHLLKLFLVLGFFSNPVLKNIFVRLKDFSMPSSSR